MKYFATLLLLGFLSITTMNAAEVKSVAGGHAAVWSANSTWSTAGIPQPGDNVTISDGDTITIDMDATVVNLTVGSTGRAVFQFPKTKAISLTVNGNLTVLPGANLRAQTSTLTVAPTELIHTLTLSGNFTSAWADTLDCRVGTTGSTMAVINFVLTGSTNTTFTTNPLYNTSSNELNGMTVNKSGTGKVTLGSNITFAGGSTSSLASTSIVSLINGVIETGNYMVIHNSTTQANIIGASSKSYILGTLARGMSSGGATSKDFPVGDASGYRPLKIHSTTGGSITGHYASVRAIKANANTGSSVLSGGIDKVSGVRYYEIKYGADLPGAPTSMSFDKFAVTYGNDDGVGVKNNDLRVAYSIDKRATWLGMGQSVPDTTFQTDTTATADSLVAPGVTIDSTQSIYVALARATGTTTNTLVTPGGTAVTMEAEMPGTYSLEQNYPNPFNPSTTVKFSIAAAQDVRLTVYDLLGRTVASLVNSHMQAGTYAVQWNASTVPSGMYIYRLEAGNFSSVKKLTLLK
jgi:hypothetical protein